MSAVSKRYRAGQAGLAAYSARRGSLNGLKTGRRFAVAATTPPSAAGAVAAAAAGGLATGLPGGRSSTAAAAAGGAPGTPTPCCSCCCCFCPGVSSNAAGRFKRLGSSGRSGCRAGPGATLGIRCGGITQVTAACGCGADRGAAPAAVWAPPGRCPSDSTRAVAKGSAGGWPSSSLPEAAAELAPRFPPSPAAAAAAASASASSLPSSAASSARTVLGLLQKSQRCSPISSEQPPARFSPK